MTAPLTHDYYRVNEGGLEQTCAIGAAAYGAKLMGLHTRNSFGRSALWEVWAHVPAGDVEQDENEFFDPLSMWVAWPALEVPHVEESDSYRLQDNTVYNVITYLNDVAGWTREAIADYLEEVGY